MLWWIKQVGRASSRLLNALAGGEGDTTFSAYSFELMISRTGWMQKIGWWRVWLIDTLAERLTGREFHCLDAWLWHQERRLFVRDEAG